MPPHFPCSASWDHLKYELLAHTFLKQSLLWGRPNENTWVLARMSPFSSPRMSCIVLLLGLGTLSSHALPHLLPLHCMLPISSLGLASSQKFSPTAPPPSSEPPATEMAHLGWEAPRSIRGSFPAEQRSALSEGPSVPVPCGGDPVFSFASPSS